MQYFSLSLSFSVAANKAYLGDHSQRDALFVDLTKSHSCMAGAGEMNSHVNHVAVDVMASTILPNDMLTDFMGLNG